MKKTAENGRSMVEMLGVLAVIGVLSIGGIIGYKRAMEMNQVNTIMFSAKEYAGAIYTGKGARNEQYGNPQIPSADELSLNPLHIGIHVSDDYLKEIGVELWLSFFNINQCRMAADLVHETCIIADDVCRTKPNGLSEADAAKVVGCFSHVFPSR